MKFDNNNNINNISLIIIRETIFIWCCQREKWPDFGKNCL